MDTIIAYAITISHFLSSQMDKYNLDLQSPSSFIPIILSLLSIYFTVVSLYRTTRWAIRLSILLLKWCVILWTMGSIAGLYLSGGAVFGWAPVISTLVSHSLRYVGWEQPPRVEVNYDGVRVNGVPLMVPDDYHKYGAAWSKFKRSSSKKRPTGGIFDRFDSKSASTASSQKRPQPRSTKNKDTPPFDAASIAERVIANVLDFHPAEVWQSVEELKEEFQENFHSIKDTLRPPNDEVQEARAWWATWWDDETDESEKDRKVQGRTRQS